MNKPSPISDSHRALIAELANRQLSAEEWRAQEAIPLSPEEIEHTLALVTWFTRRYPSAADRLAYARRAYARWKRAARPAGRSQE